MKIIFSYLSLTRGHRNSGTTIAVSTYSAQILVSKYHTLIKGITVLREMAGSLLKGKAEDESSIMLYQKRRKCSKKKKKPERMRDVIDTEAHLEEFPMAKTGQSEQQNK